MEYYQVTQNRSRQTAAVIAGYVPGLKVGTTTGPDLLTLAAALDGLAAGRDTALTDYDAAFNGENLGFLHLRTLGLALPQAAEGELDGAVAAEVSLADLLAPVYAIVPRTTESAVARGKRLVPVLGKIDGYLTGQKPPRDAITAGGQGQSALSAAITAQPALEAAVETQSTNVSLARDALRNADAALDQLNKRFYQKLQAEARTNAALATALGQIDTSGQSLPPTLGIRTLAQGGTNGLQIVVSYDKGSYDAALTNTLEWMVTGVDQSFTHTLAAAPSGNEIGPFTLGQTVQLRTRTTNANGTTTGSVRTLKIQPPM